MCIEKKEFWFLLYMYVVFIWRWQVYWLVTSLSRHPVVTMMWAISPRGVIPWSPGIKQLKLTRWQSGQDYNILLSIKFNNDDLPRDSFLDIENFKYRDIYFFYILLYEYGYQSCIWDLGFVLSEQSNYPIKIGPGPHLIVSGVQVSEVSEDHKHFTSPLPLRPSRHSSNKE